MFLPCTDWVSHFHSKLFPMSCTLTRDSVCFLLRPTLPQASCPADLLVETILLALLFLLCFHKQQILDLYSFQEVYGLLSIRGIFYPDSQVTCEQIQSSENGASRSSKAEVWKPLGTTAAFSWPKDRCRGKVGVGEEEASVLMGRMAVMLQSACGMKPWFHLFTNFKL